MSGESLGELAMQLQNHLDDCYEVRVETNKTLAKLADKLAEIEKLPMRAVKWIGTLIVGAAITMLTQNFILHQESQQVATVAATQATVAASSNQKVLSTVQSIKAAQQAAP